MQKNIIELLQDQIKELNHINDDTEKNYSCLNEKYLKKKKKMNDMRTKMQKEYSDMVLQYEDYIKSVQRVLCRDHYWHKYKQEYSDIQIAVSNAKTKILMERIDKYLEVAKQAKAVLRIPRLCTLYHNSLKGLTE